MIKIKNPNEYKVNDTVWWFDAYGTLRKGVIYEIGDTHALIYEDGKKGVKTGAKLSDCWPTKDACLAAENQRSALQRTAYKESIRTVSDLVHSCLSMTYIASSVTMTRRQPQKKGRKNC